MDDMVVVRRNVLEEYGHGKPEYVPTYAVDWSLLEARVHVSASTARRRNALPLGTIMPARALYASITSFHRRRRRCSFPLSTA
jgi:hypothetical protein